MIQFSINFGTVSNRPGPRDVFSGGGGDGLLLLRKETMATEVAIAENGKQNTALR